MTESRESTELAAELALETEKDHGGAPWHKPVAFTTLVIAVLAAVAALFAGMTAHEILVERTEEIIDVAIAQGDLERAETLHVKNELLAAMGLEPDPEEIALAEELEREAKAELELAAEAHQEALIAGSAHLVLALSATVFAVAIAVAGLSVIVDRRWLWTAGLIIAAGGTVTLGVGLVRFLT